MLKVKTLWAINFKRNTQKYIEKILNNFAITNLKRRKKKKMNKPENPQCYLHEHAGNGRQEALG